MTMTLGSPSDDDLRPFLGVVRGLVLAILIVLALFGLHDVLQLFFGG
jgi:hypothetical protein